MVVSPRNSARTVALFAQVGGAVDALPIPCGTYQSRTWDLAVSPGCLYSLLRLVDLINEMPVLGFGVVPIQPQLVNLSVGERRFPAHQRSRGGAR